MTGPRQLADALIVAERERKPIAAVTDMYPFLDVGRAYEAQRLFVGDRGVRWAGLGGDLRMTQVTAIFYITRELNDRFTTVLT
jgi:2-keto-4-pentenoate hydratase